MKHLLGIIALLIVATALLGCTETTNNPLAGSDTSKSTYRSFGKLNNSNGLGATLDGTNPTNFTNNVTLPIDVYMSSEYSIWVSCSGNMTALRYQTSPDSTIWRNGTTTMAPCLNNLSVYEPSEKAVRYFRFFMTSGIVGSTNQTNLTLIVSAK
jgi:hypothetical protein